MSESMTAPNAQTQNTTLTDTQLRAVLDEYAYARSADVQSLSTKVDTISQAVASDGQKIDSLSTAVAENSASTVTIDAGQWQEMRESWLYCKSGIQVGLFLVLVLSLIVAALFGNRLWSAFAKGWRK